MIRTLWNIFMSGPRDAIAHYDRVNEYVPPRKFVVLYTHEGHALPNWRVEQTSDGRFIYPNGDPAIQEEVPNAS
jgi:hypothetical protein